MRVKLPREKDYKANASCVGSSSERMVKEKRSKRHGFVNHTVPVIISPLSTAHFRVPLSLSFKANLSAKFLLW